MFVPCPNCGFLVALIVSRRDQLQRCPRCQSPLQVDPLDDEPRLPDTTETEPSATDATSPVAPPAPVAEPPPAAPAAHATPPPRHPSRTRAPSFARRAVRASGGGRRWPAWLAVAGLALALVAQLVLAQWDALAARERWRPALSATCGVLGCELPAWREPTAFTMLARSVQPGAAPGVLVVNASFRNDARFPQPWPALRLGLSDVDGLPVAARVFSPAEYGAAASAGLAPGQAASIRFEVLEPAPGVVAFTFDFR